MPEQEKNKSSGMKAIMQEQKKQKAASLLEQGKGTPVPDEAKKSMRRMKGARAIFTSDADRKLDGERYRLGDMVWAKVKSHPWWPGQLYDPKLASVSAMELKRDSCFLVAFFGDSTFGWFGEAELIPFAPNFAQKSKQTLAHNFVDAVEDALEEVYRRVKAGLTCGCCISGSTSEEERKPGLLYDRQLRDVRSTFKPATLFTFMKDLACSPLSLSQNMLGSTIARAQTDAFRLLTVSKASELWGTQVLGDLGPSNQIKAQVPNDVRIPERSKDKYITEKGITKKHVSSVQSLSQEHKDLNCMKNTNEKLGVLDKFCKVKQHSMSSSPKKASTEKSKGSHGEKGGTKGFSSKNKGPKPAEKVVRDSRTMDVTVSHKILPGTDERDLGGSGWSVGLPESYEASAVSDEGIQNAPSLVVRDSLALNQEKKSTETKNLGVPTNDKIVMISKVDAKDSQAFPKKPTAVAMKVKAANVDVGQFSKTKAVKKAKAVNVEMEQIVKVANVDVDQVSKAKRMAEHNPTEGSDASSVEVKKRKVSAKSVCNDESDRSLKEDVGASVYMLQQQEEEVMSDPTALESDIRQLHVHPLVSMDATEDVSTTPTSELDSEVNRLQQEEALQETPEENDALAPLVAGPQLLKQGDQLEGHHKAVSSLQAKNYVDVSKKTKKKPKDTNTVEPLKPEGDGALAPLVTGPKHLKQGEQVEVEHEAVSSLQVKNSADISTKKKKRPKNNSSVQPFKPDDDALRSLVERLKQGDQLGAEHKAQSRLQAKDINKKKKKLDTNTVDPLNSEGNTDSSAVRDGKENAKSIETCSKVMEDQTSQGLDASPLEVDPRVMDSGGIGSSLVSCGAVEALQYISKKKKEIPAVKYGQEEKKTIKSGKEVKESKGLPPPNKVTVSKKRVLEEKDHLSKDFRARSKKVKTVVMEIAPKFCEGFQGEDSAEQHEGPTKKRKGSAQYRDLREGLLSVAAKPLDSIKEEFYPAVHTAFMNFRKAVYQGPEDSITLGGVADAAMLQASDRTGLENSKTLEPAREQTEVSSERGSQYFKAEGPEVEDVRTEKEGEKVPGGGKQSGEDNTSTPSKLLKKSVSFAKKVSSSSISLRPAIDVKIPVRGSKEILNRFGQRVPQLSNEAERLGIHPSRTKNAAAERALMISFPQGFPLPSELHLMEVFAKFGDLNLPLTRIDSRSGCARIIFRRTQDAEAALSSMKENPVYENARFWLKPRDADVGELSKQISKNTSSAERPALSRSNTLEAKTASGKLGIRTALDKRVPVSTENDIASDRRIQIEDRSSMPQNSISRKAGASGKGAHVSLKSNCGVMNAQPSLSATTSEKAPIGNSVGSSAGRESLKGIARNHSNAAALSSCPPSVGPRSLDMPANIDISEPFLALLHQLHDLLLSIGFTF